MKLGEVVGCQLCPLLLNLVPSSEDDTNAEFRLVVDVDPENPVCKPEDMQILHIQETNTGYGRSLYMYAAEGMCRCSNMSLI